ncbi:hypothetical protein K458DRAFT_394708 [Lentithecium fluviatile CBS 122367]|uniref:Uncharacterized protein n=1 Tax=Lentithecium fluviatile CBS 122367 TaxID=1168545 RepID=A0A6G1IK93_9PLEO|nr:hypothetical protein K458DRAFT_394708 [Lentithecium fluviatile CBS 122367]
MAQRVFEFVVWLVASEEGSRAPLNNKQRQSHLPPILHVAFPSAPHTTRTCHNSKMPPASGAMPEMADAVRLKAHYTKVITTRLGVSSLLEALLDDVPGPRVGAGGSISLTLASSLVCLALQLPDLASFQQRITRAYQRRVPNAKALGPRAGKKCWKSSLCKEDLLDEGDTVPESANQSLNREFAKTHSVQPSTSSDSPASIRKAWETGNKTWGLDNDTSEIANDTRSSKRVRRNSGDTDENRPREKTKAAVQRISDPQSHKDGVEQRTLNNSSREDADAGRSGGARHMSIPPPKDVHYKKHDPRRLRKEDLAKLTKSKMESFKYPLELPNRSGNNGEWEEIDDPKEMRKYTEVMAEKRKAREARKHIAVPSAPSTINPSPAASQARTKTPDKLPDSAGRKKGIAYPVPKKRTGYYASAERNNRKGDKWEGWTPEEGPAAES